MLRTLSVVLPTSHPDPESSTDADPVDASGRAAAEPGSGGPTGTESVTGVASHRRAVPGSHSGARGDVLAIRADSGRSDSTVPVAVPATIAAASVPFVLAVVSLAAGLPAAATITLVGLGAVVCALITTFATVRPLTQVAVTAVMDRSDAEQSLADERAARSFRDRLDRALRASQSEPSTIGICLRAVNEILPESEVSLLLNLPGEAAVGWRVDLIDGRLRPAVPVPETPTCVGLTTLSTAISSSTTILDACGHLDSAGHDVSSVCVPLLLGERTLGAVCATSAPGEIPALELIERIEWVIERAAVRVAEQRLQRGPSVAGRPDPVTGLPGPSALRNQLRDLVRTLSPFCVSIVSIDAFDQIRYSSGEDVADWALGLAADALCSTLRPDDLICRMDGPRFAVVFADCTARQATAAMERFRESLALTLSVEEDQVPFTCSAGLVESHRATSLESLIELSASACAQAEAAGGNRVTQSFER